MKNISFRVGNFKETWEETNFFCPNCGTASVFEETGSVDPEYDSDYLCVSCGASFLLPGEVKVEGDEIAIKRLENLRHPEQAKDIEFPDQPIDDPVFKIIIRRMAECQPLYLFSQQKELPETNGRTIKWRRYANLIEEKQ